MTTELTDLQQLSYWYEWCHNKFPDFRVSVDMKMDGEKKWRLEMRKYISSSTFIGGQHPPKMEEYLSGGIYLTYNFPEDFVGIAQEEMETIICNAVIAVDTKYLQTKGYDLDESRTENGSAAMPPHQDGCRVFIHAIDGKEVLLPIFPKYADYFRRRLKAIGFKKWDGPEFQE